MRIVHVEEVSVYEAFQKYGLGDGDAPFAHVVLDKVISTLRELGYRTAQIGGLHNHAIAQLERRPSGRVVDVAEAASGLGLDVEDSPGAVRQVLLATGLHEVVEALDRLDQEEVCYDLPSYVLVRHPNQGHVIDVRPFGSDQAAARFAMSALEAGEDVELIVPTGETGGGRARYRQVIHDEELEELAGEG
jgi:hypothetical protein